MQIANGRRINMAGGLSAPQCRRARQPSCQTSVVTRKNFFLEKMSALLLFAVFALFAYKLFSRRTVVWRKVSKYGESDVLNLKQAPGPIALPVIGSMHLLGKRESPFQSFTDLAKVYGDIFSIKLGAAECLVVNNLELIREVLNQNGKFFGGRPDFLRFHKLFAGDRNNCKYFFFFSVINIFFLVAYLRLNVASYRLLANFFFFGFS